MSTNDARLTARLLSACPPDAAQKAKLEDVLAKRYGRPVALSWQEDKTVSGGASRSAPRSSTGRRRVVWAS